MRPPSRPAALMAALLVAALTSGCSVTSFLGAGRGPASVPARTTPAQPPGTAAPTTTPTATPTPTPSVPAGSIMVTTPRSEIAFALPEDWTVIDSRILTRRDGKGDLPPEVSTLADALGLPEEEVIALIEEEMELMAVGEVRPGFTDSINVTRLNDFGIVPGEEIFRNEFTKLGWDVGAVEKLSTPSGARATVVRYSIDAEGPTAHGVAINFLSSGEALVITVTASSDAAARATSRLVLDTLTLP